MNQPLMYFLRERLAVDGYDTICEYELIMNLNMIQNQVFEQDLV